MIIHNPIISGFYPDPSVCRVGCDFYVACSSFEYFPAVPLHHSRDLLHWRPLGHVVTRREQMELQGVRSSEGVFAPTLRHHDGVFYLVTTVVGGVGHVLFKARDPQGPWSNAQHITVPVDARGVGFDPSLFFDDDGRVYLTWTHYGDLRQSVFDVVTARLVEPPRSIWQGAGWKHAEGPHLFKRGDWYYLTAAEGGTEYGHRQTIARAANPWGPFEAGPHNPILCHSGIESAVQITGHADFVDDNAGNTWAVFLASRVHGYPPVHHLGRETFLAPVRWVDGWPMIGDNGRVAQAARAPALPASPFAPPAVRDHFDHDDFGSQWVFLRARHPGITVAASHVRLKGAPHTIGGEGPATLLLRRQEHHACRVAAAFEFTPSHAEDEAGLVVRMNERHHYDLLMGINDGRPCVFLRLCIGPARVVIRTVPVNAAKVVLQMTTTAESYAFFFDDGEGLVPLGNAPSRYLSTEIAGGFTGVFFALYASSPVGSAAHVDWFDYEPSDLQRNDND